MVATEACYTVKEFLLRTFKAAGFADLQFKGQGNDEKLYSGSKLLVEVDPQFLRPGEVPHLLGNSSKIRQELGWKQSYGLDELLHEMLDYDIQLSNLELLVRERAKL